MPLRELITPDPHSLRWRLPATITAVIGAALIIFVLIARRMLETMMIETGGARLVTTAEEVARLLERQQLIGQLTRAAEGAVLAAHIERPAPATVAAATEYVSTLTAGAVRRAELWDAAGRRVLSIARPDAPAGPSAGSAPSSVIGPLIRDGRARPPRGARGVLHHQS